jgi:hypothetical protein
MCIVCRSLFVLFSFLLSVVLRYTDSDYPLWYLQTLCFLVGFQIQPLAMSRSVQIFTAAVSYKKKITKPVGSFNILQLSCATCDIVFNLHKLISIW